MCDADFLPLMLPLRPDAPPPLPRRLHRRTPARKPRPATRSGTRQGRPWSRRPPRRQRQKSWTLTSSQSARLCRSTGSPVGRSSAWRRFRCDLRSSSGSDAVALVEPQKEGGAVAAPSGRRAWPSAVPLPSLEPGVALVREGPSSAPPGRRRTTPWLRQAGSPGCDTRAPLP